jgi:hypothetical protein
MTKNRADYNPTPIFNRKFVRHMFRSQVDQMGEYNASAVVNTKYYKDVKKPRMEKGVRMYRRGTKAKRPQNADMPSLLAQLF